MTSFRTSVGTSDADSITVMGRDVARELMGTTTLTELAFLVVRRRMPSAEETRLLDAVLVSLADHGLTPTVLAARLTHTGAPESLQGAMAAGLLGAGSVFLGVVEDTVRFLDEIGDDVEGGVAREVEAGRAGARARPSRAQGGGPARAEDLRDRRGDRPDGHLSHAPARGGGRARRAERPGAARERRRGRGRGAGRPRLPGGAAARLRAARADRGVARTPRGRDGEPYRPASLPRGG